MEKEETEQQLIQCKFMAVLLSDEELEALEGLPHLHRCLYIFGIRRYMDYQTGITGIKRKISYKSLSEEIYVTPHQGVADTRTKSVAQLKRAVKALEKAGLITIHSKVTKTEKQLILKCILAIRDRSVQNKPVPPPYHSPVPQAAPVDNNENPLKIDLANNIEEESHTESRTTQNEKAVLHPISDTILNYTIPAAAAVDNFLSPEEAKFINLFHKYKLRVNLANPEPGARITAKALVHHRVTLEEAEQALISKLGSYKGATTPSPKFFKDAILEFKRDLEAIKQQPEETINAATTTRHYERKSPSANLLERVRKKLEISD